MADRKPDEQTIWTLTVVTEYLNDFVARNDAWLTGVFDEVDLDKLCRKYGL